MPHFRDVSFYGRFPAADLTFADALSRRCEDDRAVAVLPAQRPGFHDAGGDVRLHEHQDHHFRGQWFDDPTLYWKDFAKVGPLPQRHYDGPRTQHMQRFPEHGTLAAKVTLAPGEARIIRFVISWSFPKGDICWAFRTKPDGAIPNEKTRLWTNYYTTQWPNSRASAGETLARRDDLDGRTLALRDSLFGSSLPSEIKDAASATLALPRTATMILLEGGEIWAWEGQHRLDGSCEGTCPHVWNYQQALSQLFPKLERNPA